MSTQHVYDQNRVPTRSPFPVIKMLAMLGAAREAEPTSLEILNTIDWIAKEIEQLTGVAHSDVRATIARLEKDMRLESYVSSPRSIATNQIWRWT